MQPSAPALEELEICRRHQRHERLSGKFFKNTYICVNRYCSNSFELACSKCKNDLHKDHSIKFITLESFRSLLQLLADDEPRLPTEAYEMHKKHRLIKQFRRKMQLIESDLNLSVGRLIMWSETAETEESFNFKELSEFNKDFESLLRHEPNEFTEKCRSIGRFVDYNTKKDLMEFNSTRLKECESERRRQLEQVRKQLEEIKEYSMKIIEVVLHHIESDEEDEIQMLKKRIQTMKDDNLTSEKDQLKAYKEGIAELVADIDSKNEELGRWIKKIEEHNLGLQFDYGSSNYSKHVLATGKVEQLESNIALLSHQLEQKHSEIEDLKKKIARMADRINEKKRASVTEEESANQGKLKQELENVHNKLAAKEANELELEQRLSQNEKELHKLTLENSMMELQVKQMEQSLAKQSSQGEKLKRQCDRLKSLIAESQGQIAKLKADSAGATAELQKQKQATTRQQNRAADLQRQYAQLAERLNGLLDRSQLNSDRWKSVNDSKTQTIHKLTEKCRQLIIEAKKQAMSS